MSDQRKIYGVMGAGSFGSVVANLISKNADVLLYTTRQDALINIEKGKPIKGVMLNKNVKATNDAALFTKTCKVIFPVLRSKDFRAKIKHLAKHLTSEHIIIHGTKGFDLLETNVDEIDKDFALDRSSVHTMSEVILEETCIKRVGCFSGPNLSSEINQGQLAGTVIASSFQQVQLEGKKALMSENFKVFFNDDIKGVEFTGVLKNIMAIASGAIHGLGYGENAKAMLISRGLAEMVWMGRILGFSPNAFLGIAGIGDLVATCSSEKSRNFTLGYNISKGKKVEKILSSMTDVAEGVGTVKVIHALANKYKFRAPISQTLFKILFEQMPIKEGIDYLMHFPLIKDVEFLKSEV